MWQDGMPSAERIVLGESENSNSNVIFAPLSIKSDEAVFWKG